MSRTLEELSKHDPSDSMKRTLDLIEEVLRSLPEMDDGGDRALEIISLKEKEARDFYWRPLDSEDIYNSLIEIYKERGNREMVERYRRCLDLKEAREYTILGDSCSLMGINTKASEYLEMALDLGPSEDLVSDIEKTLARAEKRVEKAGAEIGPLLAKLEKDPTHKKNLIRSISHLIDLNRFDEALEQADRGLSTWNEDPDILYRKGCALYGKEEYKKALEIFEPLLEVNPNSNNYKRAVNLSKEMMK